MQQNEIFMSASSGNTISSFEILREDALLNIELLFELWGIDYTKVNEYEYDFLAPYRTDKHGGAVRFNVQKGKGADFASVDFTEQDFKSFGKGFDRSDFGFSRNKAVSYAFDIIGLCQRVHGLSTYKAGATLLKQQLKQLSSNNEIRRATLDAIDKRHKQNSLDKQHKIGYATRILLYCKKFNNTLGETYLNSRSIFLEDEEQDIYFHHKLMYAKTKSFHPALIFCVRQSPQGEIKGIHRIYLSDDGKRKADVEEPKLAIGDIRGSGIWFGKPSDTLHIAEGPENALTLRYCGAEFVVSVIASTNMHNLLIPDCVRTVVICPDPDKAGQVSVERSKVAYSRHKVIVSTPKKKLLKNGKFADLNDILMGVE